MSEYYENDKEVAPTRPEAAVLSGEEKNQQVHSVAESSENSDRQQEPEQKGRLARMFTYMKTRDFWIVIVLGYVLELDCANKREQ
jgi:solute carrier family 35 protein F1/2